MSWQVRDAKQRFSELLRAVIEDGPQFVAKRGVDVAVVVSVETFRSMAQAEPDFKSFLRSAPDLGELEIVRDTGKSVSPFEK